MTVRIKLRVKEQANFRLLLKIKDEKKFINIIDRKTASDNFLTKNLHLTFMKFFDIVFMVSNTHRENTTGIFRFFAKFSFKT